MTFLYHTIGDRMIEKAIEFKYLFVSITISGNLAKQIQTNAQKAAIMTGCLNYFRLRNKYMRKEISQIYKATVSPIMSYAPETRV